MRLFTIKSFFNSLPVHLIVFLCNTSVAAAPPESKEILTLSSPEDVLHFFGDCALLIDRGVANSPLGDSADEWILDNLTTSPELSAFLGLSDDQRNVLSQEKHHLAVPSNNDIDPKDALMLDDEFALTAQRQLEKLLDANQRAKLPLIYLNLEGLMALRRHQFRDLIGISPQEQKKVIAVVAHLLDSEGGAANMIHKTIFTLPSDQLQGLPRLNLELRQLSADVDHKIINELTVDQRDQLATIIVEASKVAHLVQGSGVGQPWKADLQMRKPTIGDAGEQERGKQSN